jgi:D-alanyl-D-alanine carboxypeptidase/Putative Flp pilus-assembly TadE/G-like
MWIDRSDDGQATPLLAAAVGLVALMLLALGPMGGALADRAQARTAADAAALAGAADGEDAARTMASANGAELVHFREAGEGEVVVEVRRDGVTAHARARGYQVIEPGTSGGAPAAGTGSRAGLAPAMLAALASAERLLGRPVPIVSGYRSPQQQQALWDRRASNPLPVAPPGRSLHERGLAVDVPRSVVDDLLGVADQAGLCQPLPRTDPIHFVVCGS